MITSIPIPNLKRSSHNSPDHDGTCQVDQPEERGLIAFISWINLLKHLNPDEEPFNRTPFFIQYRIEPAWPSPLRVYPGFWVCRDVALDPSFPVVLADLLGIVGCIRRDDRGMILNLRNRKRFKGWLVESGFVDIFREDGANKRKTVPIDQSTQPVPFYFLIVIITGRSPFLAGTSSVSVEQCMKSIFWRV